MKKERENYRKMRGERNGRHIRRRKKRIIEKQRGEGNRTRGWKLREARLALYLTVTVEEKKHASHSHLCLFLSLSPVSYFILFFYFNAEFVYYTECVN